ncbi:MAG: FCD domain-containing protein [Ancalomicrobiaceae bacterium]|nr:FCD domain-containing protein [Ancalomicrobiaceae bacterium]
MADTTDESMADAEAAASKLVLERLRDDIIMGVFQPGQKLRLIELKSRYETGASPLREALSRLSAQQLVTQELNRGFSVPTIDVDELQDITALRRRLEASAVRESVAHGDEAWEDELLLSHRRLKRLGPAADIVTDGAEPKRVLQWEQLHRQFHIALRAACRSQWTQRFCATLNDQFDRYRRFARPSRDIQNRLGAQHDRLLEAALDRDAETCGQLIDEHMQITGEAVLATLRTKKVPGI